MKNKIITDVAKIDNTKNKLVDLNDHLFCQLERLNCDDITGNELEDEVKKAKAMCDIAGKIVDTGRLVLDAAKIVEGSSGVIQLPLHLSGGSSA